MWQKDFNQLCIRFASPLEDPGQIQTTLFYPHAEVELALSQASALTRLVAEIQAPRLKSKPFLWPWACYLTSLGLFPHKMEIIYTFLLQVVQSECKAFNWLLLQVCKQKTGSHPSWSSPTNGRGRHSNTQICNTSFPLQSFKDSYSPPSISCPAVGPRDKPTQALHLGITRSQS